MSPVHLRGSLQGQVLRRLRDSGPQTKAQLAQALCVSRTTLAVSVRSLAAAGHVEDGPLAASSGGRRSVCVRIPAKRSFLAVSLGERRVRVAMLDGHLSIVAGVSIDARTLWDGTGSVPAGTVLNAAARVLDERVPCAIGVAAADPQSALLGELTTRLAAMYAGAPVTALPAVRAMALGERRAGTAAGIDDLLAVRLGAGVTAASIVGGELSTGATGRAGEIGHLQVEEFGPTCACGLSGCLDAFVGSAALTARASELARRGRSASLRRVLDSAGSIDLADIVAAGRQGDPVVAQIARDLAPRLGPVVASLVAQVDPSMVVLGGPVAALGPYLMDDVRSTVHHLAPVLTANRTQMMVSTLGEQAVLIGTGAEAVAAWIDTVTS